MKNKYEILGDITKIYLAGGHVAMIDTEDLGRLGGYNTWRRSSKGYVICDKTGGGTYRLHQVIYGKVEGKVIDHIDRSKLNNCKNNLRHISDEQNRWNVGKRSTNTSGFTGVQWYARHSKWRAYITVGGICKQLGYFDDYIEACRTRVRAEVQYRDKYGVQRTPVKLA